MPEEKIYYWLVVFNDNTTEQDFAATAERAIQIQREIKNNKKPIQAVIRLDATES